MTESRVREIMATKKFTTNCSGLTIFYHFGSNTAVARHGEQDFRVCVPHPIRGWQENKVPFRNPIAAATFAMRHIIPKQAPYTRR